MDNTPEKVRLAIWEAFTKGRRKYVSYPLFALFLAVGVLSAFTEGVGTIWSGAKGLFHTEPAPDDADDEDVLDEWVLVVGAFDSEPEAVADRERFVKALFRPLITPHLPPNATEEKILVVRDPENRGRWLEILDLVPGDGMEASQQAVRDSLDRLSVIDPGTEMSRWIRRGKPYYYSRQRYERTYGRVEDRS